jgi:type II secretory pathway pseudopilin PulG
MLKETNKHIKKPYRKAFTLVELILVTGMISLVGLAVAGLVRNSYEDWELGSDRSSLLQDGHAVLAQMVRTLRQARGFSSVSSPSDQDGYITFTNVDDIIEEFRLNTVTDDIEYGQPGGLSALAGPATSLIFTCYDINANSLSGPVDANSIQSVQIQTTFVDAQDSSINFTLSDRVFCQKD